MPNLFWKTNLIPFTILAVLSHDRIWRKKVGGLWEQLGKLQFDYMVKEGLTPSSNFLDVGCGSFRGGIHFIRYLENGHYFGIDRDDKNLEGGRIELEENNLLIKNPVIIKNENFNFESFNQKFDFALAQSVFTHIDSHEIKKCLSNIEKVLSNKGKFYATFFENDRDDNNGPITFQTLDGKTRTTYCDQDPYHYHFSEFQKLVEDTSLKVTYVGDWNHPRFQKMMFFTKH